MASETKKIAYNACYGGFGLSEAAIIRYAELRGLRVWPEKDPRFPSIVHYWTCPPEKRPAEILSHEDFYAAPMEARAASNQAYRDSQITDRDIERDDPLLIQVIEELGSEGASDAHAKLSIEEIPIGTKYRIDEYDGNETVVTQDAYEWKTA